VRGRTGLGGYDLTLNYVREPEYQYSLQGTGITVPVADRLGFTAKGDLGAVGAYTAAGYYKPEGSDDPVYSYLAGGDYSFVFDYDRKVFLQLEYLNIDGNRLGELLSLPITGPENKYNLLLGNINYSPDSFSSLG
ncbi:MAG: hypothetical protein ACOCQN_02080, partial [Halanaerobiaceae bacterium]